MNDNQFKEMTRKFSCTILDREDGVYGEHRQNNLLFVKADRDQAVSLLTWLRDIAGYRHLVLFTAVDQIEQGVFQLTYLLHSHAMKSDVCLHVFIDREMAVMESIHHLWPHAATYQQELYEMFGVTFPGSPRLYEDFALEGWDDIPPMRREFDTKSYSEETYFPRPGRKTHDTQEYMKEQLYPSEAETW